MTTKVVIRLLDGAGALLGWAEHQAAVRGDGMLRAKGDVAVPVDVSGMVACVSVHWADLNVETRTPVSVEVSQGSALVAFTAGAPMIQVGLPPPGLPAVTMRQRVAVAVPAGVLGTVAAQRLSVGAG